MLSHLRQYTIVLFLVLPHYLHCSQSEEGSFERGSFQAPSSEIILYDPKTGNTDKPVKLLLHCIKEGKFELAESHVCKYYSEFGGVCGKPYEFEDGFKFPPSFYVRDYSFEGSGEFSLLELALLEASKRGYYALVSVLLEDEETRNRLPELVDKDGRGVIQLAVMGGHKAVANRLSFHWKRKRSLVDVALEKRKEYLIAVIKMEKAKINYDRALANLFPKKGSPEFVFEKAVNAAEEKLEKAGNLFDRTMIFYDETIKGGETYAAKIKVEAKTMYNQAKAVYQKTIKDARCNYERIKRVQELAERPTVV